MQEDKLEDNRWEKEKQFIYKSRHVETILSWKVFHLLSTRGWIG